MAQVLIAVVLALALGHMLPQVAALRRFEWFDAWRGAVASRLGAPAALLVAVLVPVLLVLALQSALEPMMFGLSGFAFAVLVLLYTWGPRDLDLDVEAVLNAPDRGARRFAAARLGVAPGSAHDGGALVEGVFRGALQRWFGVLFWFLVLGPAGALLFRLAQIAASSPLAAGEDSGHGEGEAAGDADRDDWSGRLLRLLAWPVAQLMALALALVGHFDAVLDAWRGWYRQSGSDPATLDLGFLGAVARASVDCELIDDEDWSADEGPPPPMLELRDALSLAWRILLLWLTVVALLVLAGYVG